jgi:predicted TPR repeat methyltransferase
MIAILMIAGDAFERAKAAFFAGLARQQAGDDAAAERHYRESLTLVPGRASTLINLAAVQLRLARPIDALSSADAALAAEPDSSDALLHRATALARLGHPEDALLAFRRLLAIEPHHAAGWSGAGTAARELGRLDEAAQAFREALRHGAERELHDYYLASVQGAGAPATAPAGYVEALFDGYAGEFDRHLVDELGYQAPRRLVEGLAALGDERFAATLDLGCGTGLCGPLVRPRSERLTGVDLSARMLAQARRLGVYDRLEQAEIVAFLERSDERFDLVLAADVFIYVGDLRPVFRALQRVMTHGVFCFTVETLAASDPAEQRLLPSLRYAHAPAALGRLADAHGFDVAAMLRAPVREEQRAAVDGLYVYLRRRAARASELA